MKQLLSCFCFLVLCITSSCGQESQSKKSKHRTSQQAKLPTLLWQAPITEGQYTVGGLIHLSLYKNSIVCNGQTSDPDIERLMMINTETGKIQWEWNDIRTRKDHLSSPYAVKTYQNILALRNGTRLYAINLDSGTTIWEKRCADGVEIALLGNTLFYGGSDAFLWKGDVRTGIIDTVFFIRNILPPPSVPLDTYEIVQTYPFIDKNNDTLVAVSYTVGQPIQFEAWYLMYNISKHKLLYNANLLPRSHLVSGIFSNIQRYNDNFYFAATRSILCHSIKTGKQRWKKDFPGTLLFSGMILSDSTIFANCDAIPQFVYALEPNTGNERWKERSAGSILGQLFVMNGVLYFTGGSDGVLHAIDIKTGKHLWKIECPNRQNDSNDYFFGNVTGRDGKIFVCSGFHLYCYEVAE
ncbi:MAG: PQQ-binding-like beta-propeller repeat protein [Candidatus Kapaibacteriota bacterium]